MKEGIYIDEGKHQYHNVYTYTGFVVFFHRKLQVRPFTDCTLPHIIENIAKPRILHPITCSEADHKIMVYQMGASSPHTEMDKK